jgi:hypothetical protein
LLSTPFLLFRAFFIFFGVKAHHPAWLPPEISPGPGRDRLPPGSQKRNASSDRAGLLCSVSKSTLYDTQ